jgi:hypothetical protein
LLVNPDAFEYKDNGIEFLKYRFVGQSILNCSSIVLFQSNFVFTPESVSDCRKRISSISFLGGIPPAKISLRLSPTLDPTFASTLKRYVKNAATVESAAASEISSLRKILLVDTLHSDDDYIKLQLDNIETGLFSLSSVY